MSQNVYQPHYLQSQSRYVLGFGGTMSKKDAQSEIDRLNGKPEIKNITFELQYQDGEYLAGYTLHGKVTEELVALGLAHYVDGWGYLVNDKTVNALGTKFTHKSAVEYSQPARQAKLARERREKETRDALFAQAKSTGKPVQIRRYSDDCDDPREECSLDNVYEYAMPDGSIKTERYHTW